MVLVGKDALIFYEPLWRVLKVLEDLEVPVEVGIFHLQHWAFGRASFDDVRIWVQRYINLDDVVGRWGDEEWRQRVGDDTMVLMF